MFCGNSPEASSREHVLPQWLIRLTGDPKRRVVLGVNYGSDRPYKAFAFDQFTFPACHACNNAYSELEGLAKPIVLKLLNKQSVSEFELDTLLDWMDKIRIGVWLGGRYLSNNFGAVDPLFHISTRIGRADRALFITHTDAANGLSVTGTMSPMFAWMPSVFGLRINGMLMLSASTDLMISRELGFPFAKSRWAGDGEEIGFEMSPGSETIAPILFGRDYPLPALRVFQPVYRKHLGSVDRLHAAPYVGRNSLDRLSGRGRTYVTTDVTARWGGIDTGDHLAGEQVIDIDLQGVFGAAALVAQNELIWTVPSERRLPRPQRGRVRKFHFAYAFNKKDIQAQLEGKFVRSMAQLDEVNAKFAAAAASRNQ